MSNTHTGIFLSNLKIDTLDWSALKLRKKSQEDTCHRLHFLIKIGFVQFVTLQGFRLAFYDGIEFKLKEMRLVLTLTLQL